MSSGYTKPTTVGQAWWKGRIESHAVERALGGYLHEMAERLRESSRVEAAAEVLADERRRAEMIETYEELGFEVITVPVSPDATDCTTCMLQNPERFQVIYTRKRGRT